MAIEKLLTLRDVADVFGVAEVTVRYWVSQTRKGQHDFPLPIHRIRQSRLRWQPADIEAYLNRSNNPQPAQESTGSPAPTAAERKRQKQAAREVLAAMGITRRPAADA
jgi:predicted DNA-binding transcriptional regulator AlpA